MQLLEDCRGAPSCPNQAMPRVFGRFAAAHVRIRCAGRDPGPMEKVGLMDRIDTAYAMNPQGVNTVEDRCPTCEYTPSGIFAHPCVAHSCSECGHIAHDSGECGMPDPGTGWCECWHTADGTPCPGCGSVNTTAMSDGDDGRQLVCADCGYGT